MKKLLTLLFTLSVSLAGLPQAYGASLFKDYQFGSTYNQFSEQEGYYDCTDDLGATALCLDDVSFVGYDFELALMFSGQDLTSVSLFNDFESDMLAKVVGALIKNFSLIAMQSEHELLDIIAEAKQTKNQSALAAKIDNFESINLSNGELSYVFAEQKAPALKRSSTATEAIQSLPKGLRGVEVMVVTDEEADTFLIINFTSPRLEIERQEKLMTDSSEEF